MQEISALLSIIGVAALYSFFNRHPAAAGARDACNVNHGITFAKNQSSYYFSIASSVPNIPNKKSTPYNRGG